MSLLQVGVQNPVPSAPPLEEPVVQTPPQVPQSTAQEKSAVAAQACDAIGDGLLESMFNPNCGLDIYETCDEKTWVDCKLASRRLGFYIFAFIMVVVILIIFFASGPFGKFIAVLLAIGLFLIGKYGSAWTEKTARVEYQRIEKEIQGMMNRGNMNRKEAMNALREEKLSRERTDAIRSQKGAPAQTGVAAGIAAGIVSGLFNRGKQ
jgi:hypothetical protein